MTALTWHQKLDRPAAPKRTLLDKPFAGVPTGAIPYASTPPEIQRVVRACPHVETDEVTPLCRAITPDDTVASKQSCGRKFMEEGRAAEVDT